jgi:hypothetical protein
MNTIALRYRAEFLRAVFGSYANEGKVHDLHRLNKLCEHLAQCEEAQTALRARGYGSAGMSFGEVVREVPVNALGRIKGWFSPKASAEAYPDLGEVHDIWTAR